MIRAVRIPWLVALCTVAAILSAGGRAVWAQAEKEKPRDAEPFTVSVNREVKVTLYEVHKAIEKAEEWDKVTEALQRILSAPTDTFIDMNPGPVSARAEVNRLLASLPAEGRKLYQTKYGAAAAERLKEAREKKDPEQLAAIVRQYFHTEAGLEAALLLAKHELDADQPSLAALLLERLRSRPDAPTDGAFLYALARARARSGASGAAEAWKLLLERAEKDGGITVDGRQLTVEQLKEQRDKDKPAAAKPLADWPFFRGGPRRSEQSRGDAPFLEAAWTISTMPEKRDVKAWTEAALNKATVDLHNRNLPMLWAFFPVAVGNRLIYRTYDNVVAVDLKQKGQLEWWHQTDGGLQTLLSEPTKKTYLEGWKNQYQQMGPFGVLFENSTTGTLATDGVRVFVIDDLALTPPMNLQMAFGIRQNLFGPLTEAVNRNTLKGIHLESGKLLWELSGKSDDSDLKDSIFLGAPLVLDGKLYVLREKKAEVSLVCLELKDTVEKPVPPTIVWQLPLGTVGDPAQTAYVRRTNALHLAYADGVLVCPTGSGAVCGVDLLTRNHAWVHPYREAAVPAAEAPPPFRRPRPGLPLAPPAEWKASAPAVIDGKVVFTAADSNSLHCIDLHTGAAVWKIARATDDEYFAGVFADKVLIVGKNYVRAVRLDDGQPIHRLDHFGVVCGQGAASDNIYYLPVTQAGPNRKQSGVLAVDLERFVARPLIVARNGEALGNLLFHDGLLLSQTLTAVTAYPQLKVKLALLDERLKANPKDPLGLLERGELRLDKGELRPAYEDLHAALDNELPENLQPKLKLKLFETLTEWLRRDFAAAEGRLDEYKALCAGTEDAAERRQRLRGYLRLLGAGRETQARPLDAVRVYEELAVAGTDNDTMLLPDEPGVRVRSDAWARSRIAAVLARATPEQRQAYEERAAAELKKVLESKELDALRKFVQSHPAASAAGREARFQLAERLLADAKDNKADDVREAQVHLLRLTDDAANPESAGRAVEALARLMVRLGRLEDAVFYYRKLGMDFPKTVIRDKKTGAEILDEIKADKRFLKFFEASGKAWPGKFKVEETFGQFGAVVAGATLQAVGETTPLTSGRRLEMLPTVAQLRLVERATNRELWKSEALPSLQYLNFLNQMQTNVSLPFTSLGDLAVVPLGYKVVALDCAGPKKLWEFNLYQPDPSKPDSAVPPQIVQLLPGADGAFVLLYADGFRQRLGQTYAGSPTCVCIPTRHGLYALDPLTGAVLWTRSEVGGNAVVFGDREFVCAVDLDPDGQPSAGRVFRTEDGGAVADRDFAAEYKNRVRVVGRNLLVLDEPVEDKSALRLRDPAAGKDVWKRDFPTGSRVVSGSGPAAVLTPEGDVHLLDLRTGATRQKLAVKKDELAKLESSCLLEDADSYYLILNRPLDRTVVLNVWPNTNPTLHSLPVNGVVLAFDRRTGAPRWGVEAAHQTLVLEQFPDLPALFFTSRVSRLNPVGGNRVNQFVTAARLVDKTSGKLLYDKELAQNGNNFFHQIAADEKAGTIEFTSFSFRLRLVLEKQEKAPAK